jgi:hypothetical protein
MRETGDHDAAKRLITMERNSHVDARAVRFDVWVA